MPNNPNGFYVAQSAQNMARNAHGTDAMLLQKLAIVSMCAVALGSVITMGHQLYRDLHPRVDFDRRDSRSR